METRKLRVYEISYKNETGVYSGCLAQGVSLNEIIKDYQKELEKTNNAYLEFSVRETEYEYVYKYHPKDKVYYFLDEDEYEEKYNDIVEAIVDNNFEDANIGIYYYHSLDDFEECDHFYYDFNPKYVINKETLSFFKISSEGIRFFISEQDNDITRKLI